MNDRVSRRDFLGVLGTGSLLPGLAAGQTFTTVGVPSSSHALWDWVRAQLVLEPGLAWLDSASFGPTLRAALGQGFRSRERQSSDFEAYATVASGPDAVRRRLTDIATFLGTTADDLALTRGADEALAIVAQGLDLQPGDEVVTTAQDRDGAVYPWLLVAKRRGIKVTQLPHAGVPGSPDVIVGRFVSSITPKTRVLAFAHVQASDGTVMPVRELCTLARSKGIFTVVDGALAPGMLDLRIADLGCDAYAASFHHWLNAPYGTGALYLERAARARVWPLVVDSPAGWDVNNRSGTPYAASLLPETQAKYGALSRYDTPDFQCISPAIELQQTVSRARIGARILELASYTRSQLGGLPAAELLTPSHPSLAAGIVTVRFAGRDHAALARALVDEDRVAVGCATLGPALDAIRVSLHPCVSFDDLDRLAAALRRRL
jgi:isopenicillin-N epimerase